MTEIVLTIFVPAQPDEPAHTLVHRLEFQSATDAGLWLDDAVRNCPGVVHHEFLHA